MLSKYKWLEEDFKHVYRHFRLKCTENKDLVQENEKLRQKIEQLQRNQKLLLENILPLEKEGEHSNDNYYAS